MASVGGAGAQAVKADPSETALDAARKDRRFMTGIRFMAGIIAGGERQMPPPVCNQR